MICRVWECWALGSHLLRRTRSRVPINQVGREREREVGFGFFQMELWVCLTAETEEAELIVFV